MLQSTKEVTREGEGGQEATERWLCLRKTNFNLLLLSAGLGWIEGAVVDIVSVEDMHEIEGMPYWLSRLSRSIFAERFRTPVSRS